MVGDPHYITKTQERCLRGLADAANPREGLPLGLEVGIALARRGWAEQGSKYPLYRITEAGRRALSAERANEAS